jgi:hypothetical protein
MKKPSEDPEPSGCVPQKRLDESVPQERLEEIKRQICDQDPRPTLEEWKRDQEYANRIANRIFGVQLLSLIFGAPVLILVVSVLKSLLFK